MIAPDEYVFIRPLDALVQWLHDWGIERRSTIRFLAVTSWAAVLVFCGMRHPGDFITPLFVGIFTAVAIVLITFGDEVRSQSKFFNFHQITHREGVVGWLRLGIMCSAAMVSIYPSLLANFDSIFYFLWFYSTMTLKPIDKPKHHWRELLPARMLPDAT